MHCKVLFVGTEMNLRQIYADCPDSSSETNAEMAFSYDWLSPYSREELLNKGVHASPIEYKDCEFTKEDTELYDKFILGRYFYDCFDIRDNTSNHRISELSDEDIDNFFKSLPEETHFFVCDGHL